MHFRIPILFLILQLTPLFLDGQSQNGAGGFLRDTSYTIHSAAAKIRRTHPFALVAAPVRSDRVRATENIAYSVIDGRRLLLDIVSPGADSRQPAPAVLLIHGGGWRSGDRSLTVPLALRLAEEGYAAVPVEYRLSPEARYPAAVHDLKAAVRWIRANGTNYGIDTSKIAALGCSAGGQLAALLGTTNGKKLFEGASGFAGTSSTVQAVIDIDGVVDFRTADEIGADSIAAKDRPASLWFGATIFQNPKIWEEASPISHVSHTTPPVAFINSSIDRFHFGREPMIRRLKALGIYSEVHTLPGTPHTFWLFEPWFDATCGYVVSFLNKTLKGAPR